MKGTRGLAIVALVTSVGLLVVAIAEGRLWTSLIRGGLTVFIGAVVYRAFRLPQVRMAWTKQRAVLALAAGIPTTLAVVGALGWVAVVSGELAIRLFSLVSIVAVLGFAALVVRIVRREHLAAVRAAD